MLTFAFDADKETPESVKRRREMILAMQPQFGRAQNVGEGIGQALTGLGMGIGKWQANKAEKAGMAGGADRWAGIMSALSGGGGIGGGSGGYPDASAPMAPMDPASARVAQAHGDFDLKGGIEQTAQALGIDPVDLATAISYETGGTFDPTKAGPTTKWGRHRGLIQFGEPQAKQYGVDWNNPVASQLGPDGAVAKYLRDTGVKPGMGLLDIYSAINAGGVGRYNASDAKAGGAPGTVADKVNKQMAGHRAKALAMFGGGAPPPAPVQTASLDPSIGMPPVQGGSADGMGGVPLAAPIPDPRVAMDAAGMLPPEAAPQMTPDMVAQSYAQTQGIPQPGAQGGAQQQIAQAMIAPNNPGNIGMMGPDGNVVQAPGAFPPPPPAQGQQMAQAGGLDLNTLMQAAGDPWLPDAAKPILKLLIEQEMQKNDPMRQLQMQNMQSEIANRERSFGMDQQKFGFDQQKFGTEAQLAREKFEWEKGKPTDDIREYDFYANHERQAGREPLGPLDWEVARRKAGATSITNTVGGETLTPGQKKIDEAFADTYLSWQAGGFADSTKQLSQLQESLAILESGENITGAIGTLPDFVQPFINEQGTIAKEQVEEVVQRNLREILGAQFTEKEGERLISRAFNPRLQPAENAKRVRRLIGQISSMAASKQAMVDYFDENGTLRGYTGPRPSMNDLNKLDFGDAPASPNKPLSEMTDEELEAIINGNR